MLKPSEYAPATGSLADKEERMPWELLRYKSGDVWEDACLELGDLLDIPPATAVDMVMRCVKRHVNEEATSRTDRVAHDFAPWITQPIRKPHMVERMAGMLRELETCPELRTVLDYGGGGGRDSILYARISYVVTYGDLFGPVTPFIEERFSKRGIAVEVRDIRDLGETRYDIINCMDVIEHVYDVEYVLADITARLRLGGHLICYPAFINLWDGEHVEKNCGYVFFWVRMLESIGFRSFQERKPSRSLRTLMTWSGVHAPDIPVVHLIRERPIGGSVAEEREAIRQELYRLSTRFSRVALKALLLFPFAMVAGWLSIGKTRVRIKNWAERILSTVIDNLAIRRPSRHRLDEMEARAEAVID